MKKIYLIGIGPGEPEYLTVQAINTMKKTDVFFLLEKEGERNKDLVKIRRNLLERYLDEGTYRVVSAKIPARKKGGRDYEVYKERVESWRQQKAEVTFELIRDGMKDGEAGAFLIWGDPCLYDGQIEILEQIQKIGTIDFEYEVIPGISSIQLLAAGHKIPLNRIGETIVVTTARHLKEYQPEEIKNMAVVLDSHGTFAKLQDEEIDIYWGAYLGSKDEILIFGRLKDVLHDIKKISSASKKQKGWLMDTYILRRKESNE